MKGFSIVALKTYLDIAVQDGQRRDKTLSFRIKPATFGSTTLPSKAKIEAVINTIFGSGLPSNAAVKTYGVRLVEDDVTTAPGGSGGSPVASTARSRSGASEYIEEIPGIDESNVSFDSSNKNAISTTTTAWRAAATALADTEIAIGDPAPTTYAATAVTDIFRSASYFLGKRVPARVR